MNSHDMALGVEIDINCTRCGTCLSVCPIYDITRHELFSPRGKMKILARPASGKDPEGFSFKNSKIVETLDACLQCGACSYVCPAGVEVDDIVRRIRGDIGYQGIYGKALLKGVLKRPRLMLHLARFFSRLPLNPMIKNGLLLRFLGLFDRQSHKDTPYLILPKISSRPALSMGFDSVKKGIKKLATEKRIVFFLGCIQNYVYPEVAEAIACCLEGAFVMPPGQVCCGMPAFASGLIDQAQALAISNILAIGAAGDFDVVVTGCASCAAMIRYWPSLFKDGPYKDAALIIASKTKEFSKFIMESGLALGISEKYKGLAMTYHAPCHERFVLGQSAGINATERLLTRLNPWHFRPIPHGCCGHGGVFSLKNAGLSSVIFKKRLDAIEENGAEVVVTTCSGCLLQFRANLPDGGLKAIHLAEA
ncbi:MAG: (Fe-S)-binding protein, partial [Dissulfurimicrobium sp.]|uniref:(Fe-S)-binding protein n=1 Tax=Dissulfurimicrobium sp. TaxID=2022436 RepID=UPI00404A1AF4